MLNRIIRRRHLPALAGTVLVVAVIGAGTATAASLVTSKDVQDNSLRSVDVKDGSASREGHAALARSRRCSKPGPTGATGATGAAQGRHWCEGRQGRQGAAGSAGCLLRDGVLPTSSSTPTPGPLPRLRATRPRPPSPRISGGVQVLGIGGNQGEIDAANSRITPLVSSSFPGRMDWTTNSPKPNRLDGWIVQFGGNAVRPRTRTRSRCRCGRCACPTPPSRSCRPSASSKTGRPAACRSTA